MIRDVVLLGVEDALSETVGKAVLASVRMSASQTFGFKGNTYLRKKISDLNKTAYPAIQISCGTRKKSSLPLPAFHGGETCGMIFCQREDQRPRWPRL